MSELEQKIRSEAERLLKEGLVDVVIAFRKEDAPLRPQPAFFTHPEDLENLTYNGLCANNLANYLTRYPRETRIGMLVRGCENRSVNALIVEKQHSRENLYLIGIPCTGIIDWRKVIALTGEDILGYEDTDSTLIVRARHQTFRLPRQELLHPSCQRCVHPNPLSADILLGEALPEGDPTLIRARVESFEALSREERTAFFRQEAERCIRCYACRGSCPMCHCSTCYADKNQPQWFPTASDGPGNLAWLVVRAFHLAGRCVGCGACQQACPAGIPLNVLNATLARSALRHFGQRAGVDPGATPLQADYKGQDPESFIV